MVVPQVSNCVSRLPNNQKQLLCLAKCIVVWLVAVSAFRWSTGTRNPCLVVVSIPPNTHCSITMRPRLYFPLVNTLSSISTATPGPPIRREWRIKCSVKISQKTFPINKCMSSHVKFTFCQFIIEYLVCPIVSKLYYCWNE